MNKVILITGASSGIGEGIARELGKAGAKVFLGARRLDRIHALADEIRSAGGEAEAQVLDVTSRQSMAPSFRQHGISGAALTYLLTTRALCLSLRFRLASRMNGSAPLT